MRKTILAVMTVLAAGVASHGRLCTGSRIRLPLLLAGQGHRYSRRLLLRYLWPMHGIGFGPRRCIATSIRAWRWTAAAAARPRYYYDCYRSRLA